ncbi:TPA: flagellar hook protein FlgE, partial [Campylobacter coli]|nr:flagellar hook protein FlgE [Campylobacter coli]
DGTTDNMKNIDLVVKQTNTAGERFRVTWNQQNQNFTAVTVKANGNSAWITGGAPGLTEERVQIITAHKYVYSSTPVNIPPMYNPDGGPQFQPGVGNNPPTDPASLNYWNAIQGSLKNSDARTFRTTEDLRELLQRDARYGVDYDGDGSKTYDADD